MAIAAAHAFILLKPLPRSSLHATQPRLTLAEQSPFSTHACAEPPIDSRYSELGRNRHRDMALERPVLLFDHDSHCQVTNEDVRPSKRGTDVTNTHGILFECGGGS